MTLMKRKKKNIGFQDEKDNHEPSTDTPCSSSMPSPSSTMLISTTTSSPSSTSSRYDSSLSLLTKKFINLIISTPGDIDLKQAAILLNVQKRRIYDITNVLEGIHLIEKVSKNHVRWIGNQIKETKPPIPHQKKRQHQKQIHRQQLLERLQKLKNANMELEMEHDKLIQIEHTILNNATQTVEHPQCYLLKSDLDQFLLDHPHQSPITTKSITSFSGSSQHSFSPSTSNP